MISTSALLIQLERIRRELSFSPVTMFGRATDENEQARETKRLELVCDQVRLIIREVKNRGNLIRAQQQGLWQTKSREGRYQAAASLKQQAENVEAVQREAENVLKLVLELLKKNGLENPMQVAKNLSDLLENFEKAFGHEAGVTVAEIQHLSSQPGFVQGHGPGAVPMEPHQMVPMLALVYLGCKWLVRKWRPVSGKQ